MRLQSKGSCSVSDIVEFPFFAHLNSVWKEVETGRRSGDKRSRDQKGESWKKLGLEGGRDLCITEGPKRSSHQPKVVFSFVSTICMEEPAILRRMLPFGIPGVLRSKAMLTCHVRNVSCTAPLTTPKWLGRTLTEKQALYRHQRQNHT